ncbi:CRS1 / YhbY (CRM) domain protein [uncultured archaeon]|nr:CRS1 / YhbY (CRM) domain protein [uncultured archaeon]
MIKRHGTDSALEPTLHIGKAGIESVVEELKLQLKSRKLVKVRFLRTAFIEGDKKGLMQKLADLSGSELVQTRGNTAVYSRKG